MKPEHIKSYNSHPIRKFILWSVFAILVCSSVYAFWSFNQILADALLRSFNSNAISDVYELNFEKLRINIFQGNITVKNVVIQQRRKPLHKYPYINSSFRLTTRKMLLKNVEVLTLLKTSKLRLLKIEIVKPDIEVVLSGEKNIMLPFADSTAVKGLAIKDLKKFIDSYFLEEFKLVDASFHITNTWKHREFKVARLNMSLSDLMISQQPGRDLLSFKNVSFRIGEVSGKIQNAAIRDVQLKDFSLNIESLNIQKSKDTLIYHFDNFSTGMKDLSIHTKDSVFLITAQSIDLSYLNKSLKLINLSFKPTISRASLQKRYNYMVPQFSGTVGAMNMLNVNFDSLIYQNKLFVDTIELTKIEASVFKDKTKPIDINHFPEYPGQMINHIPIPLRIKHIKAADVNIINIERKTDRKIAKLNIQQGTVELENFTNLITDKMLSLDANATFENKAHFRLKVGFDYLKPQFSFSGIVDKFSMPDLNLFMQSYLPSTIKKGWSDGITFSGKANNTSASGEMEFLFHGLDIDLQLTDKSKLQNSIITFAANTLLINSNPTKAGQPPRVVKYSAARDMNKGFINLILKSFFSGMKETVVLSKRNRNVLRETRKEKKLLEK